VHQLTSRRAKTKAVVVSEDRNVAGMLKNHHLAQAIGDVGFAAFRRQLTYTAAWYGCQVIMASRWEPTSKTCSGCGGVDDDLTLADRTFRCEHCGLVVDRDLNAAINVAKLAGSSSAVRRQFVGQSNRLWRGKLWLESGDSGETGPDEAGTRYVLCSGIKR
jgi:putative transposase